MTALTAFLSLVLSFAVSALSARILIPRLKKRGLSHTVMIQRNGAFTPGPTAAGMGVFPLAAGILTGVLTGGIIALFTEGFVPMTVSRVFGGLVFVLLTAFAGGADDWRSLRGRERVHPVIDLALFAVIVRFYMALLAAGGDRSDILVLPFAGQTDTGIFYDIFCFVLLLLTCYGSNLSGTDDIACTSAMFTGLSLAAAGGILGSTPAAVWGAALAGCALGGLLYGFPPAKLLCGRGGRMLFGAAAAASAMGCGAPALLFFAALPLVFEGIFLLIRLMAFAFAGRTLTADSLAGWLCEKGLSYRAVSLLMTAVSLAGLVLTVLAAFSM